MVLNAYVEVWSACHQNPKSIYLSSIAPHQLHECLSQEEAAIFIHIG
jgi:hypothetical protein